MKSIKIARVSKPSNNYQGAYLVGEDHNRQLTLSLTQDGLQVVAEIPCKVKGTYNSYSDISPYALL